MSFNIKGFCRIFVGEKTPDKNDPKYKERYEREVAAGRKFADTVGLTWLGQHFVRLAEAHKKAYIAIMLGMMSFFAVVNVVRLYNVTQIKAAAMEKQHMANDKSSFKITDYAKRNK